MRLSKYEKETIILTSEGEDTIQIYTFNTSLKRRLAEYAKKYPEVARLDRWTAEGSVTYQTETGRRDCSCKDARCSLWKTSKSIAGGLP